MVSKEAVFRREFVVGENKHRNLLENGHGAFYCEGLPKQ